MACVSGDCGQFIEAGRGVQITGTGSKMNPIRISAFPVAITTVDTSTVSLSVTGTGVSGDPYVLSATVSGSAIDGKWDRWKGTQAEYDALGSYDDNTLYAITAA